MNGNDWMDVVTVVLEQHEAAEYALREVAEASGEARSDRLRSLTALLSAHESAEEVVIHPALRSLGDRGNAISDARMSEETQARTWLAELAELDPASDEFESRFQELMAAVLQHAENERLSVLPLLQESYTDHERRAMGDAFVAAQHHRPTE
jgi:hemerythrin superfamily protein